MIYNDLVVDDILAAGEMIYTYGDDIQFRVELIQHSVLMQGAKRRNSERVSVYVYFVWTV